MVHSPVFATPTLPRAATAGHALTSRRLSPTAVTKASAEAAVSTPETVAPATTVVIAASAARRAQRRPKDSRKDRRYERWRRHRSWRWDESWQWRGHRSGTRHSDRGGCRRRSGHRSRRWDGCRCGRRRHRAFGAGAGTCLGATTFWARLGRELTDGRILNASEITSATTPTTKIIITLIAAKNGVRLGCPNAAAPKSGYMPVVKSSSSSTSA